MAGAMAAVAPIPTRITTMPIINLMPAIPHVEHGNI
jgi:hypothetical protein